MRNKKIQKIVGYMGISLVLFSFLAPIAYAANLYFFQSTIDGVVKEFGFATKDACEKEYATVNASRKNTPKQGCYTGGEVRVKSFTPATAKIGEQITITGENMIEVTSVRIGTTEATVYPDSETNVRAEITAGTTGGKITVTTKYRGASVSTGTLMVTNASEARYWYTNVQNQLRGPDGGFTTKDACEADHAKYNKDSGITTNDTSCASGTLTDWQTAKSSEKPLIPKNQDPVSLFDPISGKTINNFDVYTPLAPIGDIKTVETNNIGDYLNTMFQFAIGLCGALAVVMIIISSIQYMGNESVFGKTEAKSKIFSAILGLFIALGAYALLNTINPDLTGSGGVDIKQVSIEIINLPDAGDGTIDPGFAKKDWKYTTDAAVSPEVVTAVAKLQQGWEISQFRVYPNERMGIMLKKGTEQSSVVIDVRSGVNGFSESGVGKSGDRKTPKGSWKIVEIRTSKDGKPVFNASGSNMGASFWLLSPTINGDRGIGMHGNKNGTLSRTYGCVRLKNSDLLALLPYVKVGIPVVISE